jgi:hypothetical protein
MENYTRAMIKVIMATKFLNDDFLFFIEGKNWLD